MSVQQKYLKDENGNIFSPIVSTDSIYTGGGSLTPYIEDSGWVDMDSYINTEQFIAHGAEHMKIRRIGKIVCLTGRVINQVALASGTTYKIFSKTLPNNLLPLQWFTFQGEIRKWINH